MTGRPAGTTATLVLGGGLALGFAADRLLWAGPVGPGLAIWLALLGGSATLLARVHGWSWTRATAAWTIVAVLAGAGTAWRDAPALRLLFLGVVVLAGSQVLLEARGHRFGRTRVADHVYGAALVPALGGLGALSLLSRATLPTGPERRAAALGRGVLLAAAPLTVFSLLFVAADPGFERLAGRLIPDLDELAPHLFLVGFFGWVGAGLLGGVLPGARKNPLEAIRPPRIGIEETAVVLGLVASLFAVFVGLQFSYLFGGLETLQSMSGVTLAEYARRGFFELVAVGGLVLALLLVVGAVAPRGAGRWVFRSLAALLIALVLCVLASAALRLRLYVVEFGLTTSRLYAATVMVWLAATLVLYGGTVVRGRPVRFASGALTAGIVAVFALAAVGPDALVARTNLERPSDRPVDGAYLTSLSADAVPVILDHLHELDPGTRCRVANRLLSRWGPESDRESDWRTFNAGIAGAVRLVADPETDRRLVALRRDCP
jgi:hypothetical protein